MLPSPITSQSLNLYNFSFLVSQSKQFSGFYWEHKCNRCFLKYASVSSDSTQSMTLLWLFLSLTFVFTLYDFENMRLRHTAEIYVVLICTSAYWSKNKKFIACSCFVHNFSSSPWMPLGLPCHLLFLPALKWVSYLMCTAFSQISTLKQPVITKLSSSKSHWFLK